MEGSDVGQLQTPLGLPAQLTSILIAVAFTGFFVAIKGISSNAKTSKDRSDAVLKLIQQRRSIFPKDFNGSQVPRSVIDRALEAANWAPTHGKTEPWRFVVFAGAEAIANLESVKRAATTQLFADSPEKLRAALDKMDRKAKDLVNVQYIIAICCKRVPNRKGELMPMWEEQAACACAVQNLHLQLTAEGFCGYWSSGGTGKAGWASSEACRALLHMDGECQGEQDAVLGFFYVGASDKAAQYRAARGAIAEKVRWYD